MGLVSFSLKNNKLLYLYRYTVYTGTLLVDFTSISALSGDVLHRSWKSQGFAAQRAIDDKKVRYVDAYDSSEYDFAPIAMEIGGRPSLEFVKFMSWWQVRLVLT